MKKEKTTRKKKNESRRFMKPGKDNKEDRLNFVDFWANYIRTHSDEEWSKQQKLLIDSQIKGEKSIVNSKDD